jgi:hypothetical protein
LRRRHHAAGLTGKGAIMSRIDIKLFVLLHVILLPLGLFIIADDCSHPERWDTWYRDPSISIPYCLGLDAVLWIVVARDWIRLRNREKGFSLLQQAIDLQRQGRHQEADIVAGIGKKLLGMK